MFAPFHKMLPLLGDEEARMNEVRRLDATTRASETSFKYITSLAKLMTGMDSAAVSIISDAWQHLRARQSLELRDVPREDAFCNVTIQQAEPLVVEDATKDARFRNNPYVIGDASVRSYLGVPLTTERGYNIGALCTIGTVPRVFEDKDIAAMQMLAGLVVDQLSLRATANRDYLTGAYTRRRFTEELKREMNRVSRGGPVGTLAAIDIDHFKCINDVHGHAVGDTVLKEFVDVLHDHSREQDCVARMGGEEFNVLLPATEIADAESWAERVRHEVAGKRFTGCDDVNVSISIGLVPLTADVASPRALFEKADQAMYLAKRNGRNCVVRL